MVKLFRKQKAADRNEIDILQGVKKFCDNLLRKMADSFTKKAQRVPQQKLVRLVMSACLMVACALGMELFYTLHHKSEIKFQSIQAPLQIKPSYSSAVDADVLWRIKKFHRYLDSLHKNDSPLYDSLITSRPHLIDSLITIEQLINQ